MNCPQCGTEMECQSTMEDGWIDDDPCFYDQYYCEECERWLTDWRHPWIYNEWYEIVDIILPMTYAEMEAAGQLRLFEVA